MTYNERRNSAGHRLQTSFTKSAATAVFLGVSSLSIGLPTVATAQSYAFSSVQIEGLNRIEAATVMSYLGFARGETVSSGALNDAYQRLNGSGLFQSVELVPRGSTLVVKVTEFATINRINVEGNKRLKDDELLELITSRQRYVFDPAKAERDAQLIAEAYQAEGRLAATVTPRIIRRPQNRVDLVFEVVEGKNTEVERISFTGNRAYSDARLRRVIQSKQAGLLRFIISADTFDPDRVEFDKQLLRDFYMSRGYVDFQVVATASEVSGQQDAYFVTYEVREGQQFKYGQITTVSEVEGIDAAAFDRLPVVRTGSTYDPATIERSIARMENEAAKMGYGFVRVDPRITRNERDGTLDIEFAIIRGPRVVVERIDIEGNATTLDRVVRSQFTVVEGDPFNPRAIRAAAERIRALGYFSDVEVQAREGSSPDSVVVDVDVEEQGTGSFSIGATYSTATGLGFNLSFTETNFLGRGQYLRLEYAGSLSFDNQNYIFSFAEPNLFGRDLRLGVDAFYGSTAQVGSALYSTTKVSGELSLEFPLSELSRLRVRGGGNGANIFGYTGTSAVVAAEAARGWQIGAQAGLTYTFDTRRNNLQSPTNFYARFAADAGGFGTDNQFIKATALANVTSMVMNDEVELSATVEGGAIYSFGAGARITDRFFLGPNQFYGFGYNGVGPRDTGVASNDALGGNYFALGKIEAKFPLGLPEEYGIKGGLFAHGGTVFGLDNPGGVDDGIYWRATVGAAIYWQTPVGPIRFSYAYPVLSEAYDQEQRFGIGFETGF
jgi:outer membrane protein insertion porin family